MSRNKIEWCDRTINPLIISGMPYASPNGWHCTKITSGCKNCYAERINIYRGNKCPYDNEKVNYDLSLCCFWKLPKRSCRIFVQSMSDIFHPFVTIPQIYQIFLEMAVRRQHTWIISTKRPDRALEFFREKEIDLRRFPELKLYMLFSASTQKDLYAGIYDFLRIPVRVHGLNLEPLLGLISVGDGIDWNIIGPETGAHRRLCKIEWIEDIVTQNKKTGTPCFIKALPINGKISRNPDDWPMNLRIRQFPETK